MILIADSGATKTEWLFKQSGSWKKPLLTAGFNPWQHDADSLSHSISVLKNQINIAEIEKLVFYGAGCGTEINQQKVLTVLSKLLPNTEITVSHDLMAAAHALLGQQAGIAAYWVQVLTHVSLMVKKITAQMTSLGFILGDEGSGAHIGKQLCNAYFTQQMPKEIAERFAESYNLQLGGDVLNKVYKQAGAAAYLANFSRFAYEHKENEFIQSIINKSFDQFIDFHIHQLKPNPNLPIGFTGSVAYYFQEKLSQRLKIKGFIVGKILKSPAQGLMDYYDTI